MPSFTSIFITLAAASMAFAAPHGGYPVEETQPTESSTTVNNTSVCSAGSAVACCNTAEGSGLLGNVLSGSCTLSNLGLLAGINAGNTCEGANTYCCPTTQSGDLDTSASCSPVTL